MALEDFFTLTEMKDGLGTLARVEELISVMQKQNKCSLNNISDAARQWSTVASVLTATDNKDCLEHFIQLDGLSFLSQWLQEAGKYSFSAIDGSLEDLISSLLGALQKLSVDNEKLTSSGIGSALKELVGHQSPHIQEKSKVLLDCFNLAKGENTNYDTSEKCGRLENETLSGDKLKFDDVLLSDPSSNKASSEERACGRSCGITTAEDNILSLSNSGCPDDCEVNKIKDPVATKSDQSICQKSSILAVTTTNSGDLKSFGSYISNPCCGSMSAADESSVCLAAGTTGAVTYNPSSKTEADADSQPNTSPDKMATGCPSDMEIENIRKDGSLCNSSEVEISINPSAPGLSSPMHACKQKLSLQPVVEVHNFDSKSADTAMTFDPQRNSGEIDMRLLKTFQTTSEQKTVEKDTFVCKSEGTKSPDHHIQVSETPSTIREIGSSYSQSSNLTDFRVSRSSLKKKKISKVPTAISIQRSDIEIEYGDDALEVAVQVAKEAKREVADREQQSSSMGGDSDSGSLDSRRSDLEDGKQRKLKSTLDQSEDDSFQRGNSSRTSEDVDSEDPGQEFESPKTTSLVLEPVLKSKCNFDLNEDLCHEDADEDVQPILNHRSNLSVPKAVIATSKGAPTLPVVPLHFEGELGWRGSAATSAFRPASPWKTPDGEKTFSGHQPKTNILQIDLNLSGNDDDLTNNPVIEKEIPVSSGLPSGESSMEVSSMRADRFKFDLNSVGDENALPSSLPYWRPHNQNGTTCSSPVSSSSARQPSMRHIDLNDSPSFIDSHILDRTSKDAGGHDAYSSLKMDDPVVTIMGSRMSIEKREPASRGYLPFLANGLHMESSMGARPSMVYSQLPAAGYGYNGFALGPSGTIPTAFYGTGSIPYMIDSRGATVIPQILGSPSVMRNPSARPFFVNLGGSHSNVGAIGGPRPNLDLNSGTIAMESGSRELGGVRQSVMQGYGGLTEEQMKANSQAPPASSMGLKRKEPDCGWEAYPVGYKQVTSWQ